MEVGNCLVQSICSSVCNCLPTEVGPSDPLLVVWMMERHMGMTTVRFSLLLHVDQSVFSILSGISMGIHTHVRLRQVLQARVLYDGRWCKGGLSHVEYQMGNDWQKFPWFACQAFTMLFLLPIVWSKFWLSWWGQVVWLWMPPYQNILGFHQVEPSAPYRWGFVPCMCFAVQL